MTFQKYSLKLKKQSLKDLSKETFWYLLTAYVALVAAAHLNLFGLNRYSLYFNLFALLVGLLGSIVFLTEKEIPSKSLNKTLLIILVVIALTFVVLTRAIPYINQSGQIIPIGYDAGIYRYGISHGLESNEAWIRSGAVTPGFLYLLSPFRAIFGVDSLLIHGYILSTLLLALSLFYLAKTKYDTKTGLIALALFALSLVQFKVFEYLYFKNVIALAFAFFSIAFFLKFNKSQNKTFLWIAIALGAAVGTIHPPTFYIFGLSFIAYTFFSPKEKTYNTKKLKQNLLAGIIMLTLAILPYFGKFWPAIANVLPAVGEAFIVPGESGGTFISFLVYQFSSLIYLPFAILGIILTLKNDWKKDQLWFWTLISAIIVYAQFFFFNRFIIFLDIGLIIFAAFGLRRALSSKPVHTFALILLLILAGGYSVLNSSLKTSPQLSQNELSEITSLSQYNDSLVMVISSEYSPWVLGYSGLPGNQIIAPGMFDKNNWTKEEWEIFWESESQAQTKSLLARYDAENLYLYTGTKSFSNPCFELLSGGIYKNTCQ